MLRCEMQWITILFLVRSAVALIKELLVEDGVEYVLTEFNQDPLEQYFGKKLMRGGANEKSRSMGITLQFITSGSRCGMLPEMFVNEAWSLSFWMMHYCEINTVYPNRYTLMHEINVA